MGILSGYEIVSDSIGPGPDPLTNTMELTVSAPEGKVVVGGGFDFSTSPFYAVKNCPTEDGTGWQAKIFTMNTPSSQGTVTLTVWAVCVDADTTLTVCVDEEVPS